MGFVLIATLSVQLWHAFINFVLVRKYVSHTQKDVQIGIEKQITRWVETEPYERKKLDSHWNVEVWVVEAVKDGQQG